jgi:hypothetical protein
MGKQKGGRSKRDRKHREVQSLKFKHGNSSIEALADDDIDRSAQHQQRSLPWHLLLQRSGLTSLLLPFTSGTG